MIEKPFIRYDCDWDPVAEDELRVLSIVHLWLDYLLQIYCAALLTEFKLTQISVSNGCNSI